MSLSISFGALREKSPNTEFFLVRNFLVRKYGREKTPYLDSFHAVVPKKNFPNNLVRCLKNTSSSVLLQKH